MSRRQSRSINFNFKMGGFIGLIVLVSLAYFFIDNLFYGEEYARIIQEREGIQTQLERKQADEAAQRAEDRTAFQSDFMDGLRSLGSVVFFGVAGGIILYLVYQGTQIQRERIRGSNEERYKVLAGSKTMLDMMTGETIDMASGAIMMNQATPAKLLIMAQKARIEALTNSNQRWNSNMGKTALGAWSVKEWPATGAPPEKLLIPPDDEYDIELVASTQQLMEYSSAHRWAIGQNEEDGSLCEFDVMEDCNVMIFGAKSQGKTQLAMMLLAYARAHNWHVVVADGKGGVDFRKYADDGVVEWFELDETNILRFMTQLDQFYKERLRLMGEARCSELEPYIRKTGHALPRVLVIVEEYGATVEFMRSQKDLRKMADQVVALFGTIFKKARATGVHIVTLDQTINDNDIYNNSMKGNGLYLSYKLPGQGFRVFGFPQSVKFLERGHFIEESRHEEASIKTFWAERDLGIVDDDNNVIASPGQKLSGQSYASLFPELSGVVSRNERGQKSRCPSEANHDNSCDHASTTSDNEPTTPHNEFCNEPDNDATTGAFTTIDWSYYARVKGPQRNQILKDELPKLEGEPVEVEEVQYAIDAYQHLASKEAVYFALWGFKDGIRMDWLNDVIEEYFPDEGDE